jgi:hypothetical protein
MRPRQALAGLGLLLAPALAAQSQQTFYAAYHDGLDAERQARWQAAAAAYQRAIDLRPMPTARVITYGNNLLINYAPYTRLAKCRLESGDLDAAQGALAKAASYDEPRAEREAIAHRLAGLRAARVPKPPSQPAPAAPAPPVESPAPPRPHEPTPKETPPPAPELPQPLPVPERVIPQKPVVTRAEPPGVKPPSAPDPASPKPPAISTVAPSGTPAPPWPWKGVVGGLLTLTGASWLLYRRRRARRSAFGDPEQLGPYRIERLLGRGGFASTYLARHTATKLPVALKLLHPYRQDDPEFLRRFRQEAKLGTMLDHPNLVRMLDPGPETGTPWLAMEYIMGRRLDQELKEEGPPALPELLRIALQIAGAMAHAHALGIVHRDLKPGNVIFAGDQAKVMDFGISRIVDSTTLTTTYAFLGTPLYAAPEAQLKLQVGPAADRYAFGIMLFELLAGHPPFQGETPFEILDQHRRNPLPDLAALRPDVPSDLLDLIQRLCRKDPEQRPSDDDVLHTLTQLASPQPSPA